MSIKISNKDQIMQLLRSSGLRATKTRIAAVHILEKFCIPMDVSMLQEKIGQKNVDIVTLYRMMEVFQKKGIVRHIDLRHGRAHYELATHADHHHIVCQTCGAIEDVPGCALKPLIQKALEESEKFTAITDHTFELFGVCSDCSKSS